MKTEFNMDKHSMYLVPEVAEQDNFKELFPEGYLENSKHFFVRDFVDKFGNPTGEKYLEMKGKKPDGTTTDTPTIPNVGE